MRLSFYGHNDKVIRKAVEILSSGGLIIYPTDTVYALGCASLHTTALAKLAKIKNATEKLQSLQATPQKSAKAGLKINQDGKKRSAYSVLGYKDSNWEILESTWPELKSLKLDHKIKKQIQTNAFYEKYIGRQLLEIEELKKEKELRLNESIDFDKCSGLSNEIKEILKRNKPRSIGEARELVGMTPAAASILLRFVKK